MVIVNKILNVLIFLLAIVACVSAIMLHQRRKELRTRADIVASTLVKIAEKLDGTEGKKTEINSTSLITEELLGWERFHKSRKWDEATQQWIFTDWETKIEKMTDYTGQLIELKNNMATNFDKIRISAKFDLGRLRSNDENKTPITDSDGNPYTDSLYLEALNSVVSFESMVSQLPEKIERIGERGNLLAEKIQSISKVIDVSQDDINAKSLDVYNDDDSEDTRLSAEADKVAEYAKKLSAIRSALAEHYKTILQGFEADPNENIPVYFNPKFNPNDMQSESADTLNNAAKTLAADFRVVNKQLHELAIKTEQLEKALVQIERNNQTIQTLNIENDDLKNKNGALVAENIRVSKQLEDFKELYGVNTNVMKAGFSAKVLEANDRFDFIVLNKGRKDGVKTNVELVVHSDGKYICKVVVTKVLETTSVCDILPVTRPTDAQGNYTLAPSIGDEAVVPGVN
jgi:hypothetical protein